MSNKDELLQLIKPRNYSKKRVLRSALEYVTGVQLGKVSSRDRMRVSEIVHLPREERFKEAERLYKKNTVKQVAGPLKDGYRYHPSQEIE